MLLKVCDMKGEYRLGYNNSTENTGFTMLHNHRDATGMLWS